MTANELFQSGKLQDAIQALGEEMRIHPLDAKRRIFLFELLCFAGQYDRAEKHLDMLADSGPSAQLGTLLYRSAIHADKERQQMFAGRRTPSPRPPSSIPGFRNGKQFTKFADADERIGGALELFVAGSYAWISLEQIAAIEIAAPRRLRDLLWIPAVVTTRPAYKTMELGEVLLPVLCPLSWNSHDDSVRLGRSTVWQEDSHGAAVAVGQKIFVVDDEEIPILELGRIEFSSAQGEGRAASA